MRPSSVIESKEVEHDPEVLECAWEFILQEQRALERMCRQMSRGDAVLAEDIMSDVVPEYVPKAIACWDPTKSSLRSHVMRSLRLYAWKFANYRFAPGDAPLYGGADDESEHPAVADVAASAARGHTPRLDLGDEIGYILSRIPAFDRSLLSLYFLCGMSHEEIGATLGVSKGTARQHHKRAMAKAQEVVKQLYDDEGECFDPDAYARRATGAGEREDDSGVRGVQDAE